MLNWLLNIFSDSESQSKIVQGQPNTSLDESIPEFHNEVYDIDEVDEDFYDQDDQDSDMLDEDEDILY
ncbi:MAG TPA: hypothetical protein VNR61_02430 [Niallia sp.]|nr:hypothetical protein [Niallia sp.]